MVLSILPFDPDLQSSSLRISQIRAGSDFKVLLLSRGPSLHITGLHFQISQIAGTTFQCSYRNIQTAEEIDRILPKLIVPVHRLFRFTNHNHLLLLELMNPVHSSFFNPMRSLLFPEAGGIRGQRKRKGRRRQNLIDKTPNHGMLGSADQVEIFSFNLVHHGIHFRKGHHAVNHFGTNHIGRNDIGKSSVNHKISGIRKNSGMKACHIANEVVETVSGNSSRTVQIQAAKAFHNIRMIRNGIIRNKRLSKALVLHITAVILSNRYGRINHVRNHHHALQNFFL